MDNTVISDRGWSGTIHAFVTQENSELRSHCLKLLRFKTESMFDMTKSPHITAREKAYHIHKVFRNTLVQVQIHESLANMNHDSFSIFEDFWYQEDHPVAVGSKVPLKGLVIMMERLTCSLREFWDFHWEQLSTYPSVRLCIFVKLLDSLKVMHSNMITHRNITFENIFVKVNPAANFSYNLDSNGGDDDPLQTFPIDVKLTGFGNAHRITTGRSRYKGFYNPIDPAGTFDSKSRCDLVDDELHFDTESIESTQSRNMDVFQKGVEMDMRNPNLPPRNGRRSISSQLTPSRHPASSY